MVLPGRFPFNGASHQASAVLLLAVCRVAGGVALSAGVAANPANPVNKVVELLSALAKQLKEDTDKDANQFDKYKRWFDGETQELNRVIVQTKDLLKASDEDLKQQEAFAVSKRNKLDKAAADLASADKELADAKEVRQVEGKTFKKNEVELVEAQDQFERALEVMARKQPAAAAFLDSAAPEGRRALGGAALLHVAQQLRRTVEISGDLSMSDEQRAALGSFVRFAARSAKQEAQESPPASQELQLDFLQVQSRRTGRRSKAVEGEMDDGGVAETIKGVLEKTNARLSEIRQKEVAAQRSFTSLAEGLEQESQSHTQTMQNLKMEISQHQQKSGELKSVILAGNEKLKVSQDDVADMRAEFERKSKSYNQRAKKRADETLAVKEAHQILSSPDAQNVFKASFVQELLPDQAVPALVQLSRATAHRHAGADPFGKVKKMVSSMLRKLQDDQADEQKHAGWCDKEMTKTKASQKQRSRDVEKVADRISEMEAELEQLQNDLTTISQQVQDLNGAVSKAQQLRGEESKRAGAAIAQYSQGAKLVTTSISVLREYYAAQEKDQAANKEHGFEPSGAGSQVIGILEVAEEDYLELLKDQKGSEVAAQKDFNDFMNDFQVRMAVFNKDLEYKQRAKTKVASERMRATEDLKNYQKELEAVLSYMQELEASCTIKGDSYDERRAKREQTLASLREALTALRSQE